jgi:hypothetical protein
MILLKETQYILNCIENYNTTLEQKYLLEFISFLENYKNNDGFDNENLKNGCLEIIKFPNLPQSDEELKKNPLNSSFLKTCWKTLNSKTDNKKIIWYFVLEFINDFESLFDNKFEQISYLQTMFAKKFETSDVLICLFNKKLIKNDILLSLDLSKSHINYLLAISYLDIDFNNLNKETSDFFSKDFITSFLFTKKDIFTSLLNLEIALNPFISNNSIGIFKQSLIDNLHLFNETDKKFAEKILLNIKLNNNLLSKDINNINIKI